jgi:hypothetical protein
MWKLEWDDSALVRKFSDLEETQLPFATMQALNDAMFAVRDAWKQAVPQVFEQPTPFTLNSVLFKKATKSNLVAEVFLRDEAGDGTPPARYLATQARAGAREEKPIEFLLRRAGLLDGNEFLVPAKGFPLDAFGNVPGGVVNALLSDLQASRDPLNRSTPESRARRSRKKDASKRGVYFMGGGGKGGTRGSHLPKAIFQRTSFGSGSAIRMVYIVVRNAPRYRKRFDGAALAQSTFSAVFPDRFRERLRVAVLNARIK